MLINAPQNYINGRDFSGELLYFTSEETEAQEDEVP